MCVCACERACARTCVCVRALLHDFKTVCFLEKYKKVCFYIAQYLVFGTVQSALHFTPGGRSVHSSTKSLSLQSIMPCHIVLFLVKTTFLCEDNNYKQIMHDY